jgi:hypothetical protein
MGECKVIMHEDAIQPERAPLPRRPVPELTLSGRAWVRHDLDFWERCTIERCGAAGVTVVLDNMDERTVSPDDVEQFDLEPGQLVFVHGTAGIGGTPGFVVSVAGESLQVEFPQSWFL